MNELNERLDIQCFGRFRVKRRSNGEPITSWGRRKTQQLLKILIQNRGKVLTQDQLIEHLFPGQEPSKAVQNLHARISELRRILQPELQRGNQSDFVISECKGRYFFTDSVEICALDVDAFEGHAKAGLWLSGSRRLPEAVEELKRALGYLVGDYLEEDLYEEWTQERRQMLHALRLDVLTHLARAQTHLLEYSEAVRIYTQILKIDPFSESACRELMRLNYLLGRKGDAVDIYRRCVAVFKSELDTEPSWETERLYDDICSERVSCEKASGFQRNRDRQTVISNTGHAGSDSLAQIAYQRGQFFLNRHSGLDAAKAIAYFQQVLERDPQHAPSHAALASAYCQRAWFNAAPVAEMHASARASIARALKFNDRLPEAYVTLAYIKMNYEWNGDGAYGDLLSALEMDPHHAMAYRCIAGLMAVRGNLASAVTNIEQAYELEPLSFNISIPRAWIYYLDNRYQDVVVACTEILELDPHLVRAHTLLGLAHEQLGNGDDAERALRKASKLSRGNAIQMADLAHFYGKVGERERSTQLLESISMNDQPSIYLQKALVQAGLERADKAVQSLRASWTSRSWNAIFAQTDPRFKALSSYGPYVELQEEIHS